MLTYMLLLVFFTFKISFVKKNINKNCPVNLNTNTTTVLELSTKLTYLQTDWSIRMKIYCIYKIYKAVI